MVKFEHHSKCPLMGRVPTDVDYDITSVAFLRPTSAVELASLISTPDLDSKEKASVLLICHATERRTETSMFVKP